MRTIYSVQNLALLLTLSTMAAPMATHVAAQSETSPSITTHGEGMADVTPDRAVIRLAVETTAPTAQAAGSENARIATRIASALKGLGIQAPRITTAGYTISPQYRYRANQEPAVTGYRAANTVIVNVDDIRKVGPVIDASLSAGANRIDDLTWQTADPSAGRLEAIGKAVAQAKREAEAAATAAGTRVRGVLSIDIDAPPVWGPRPMMAMAARADGAVSSTPIEPGTGQVRVSVSVRWKVE